MCHFDSQFLAAFARGELSDSDHSRAERHLSNCSDCVELMRGIDVTLPAVYKQEIERSEITRQLGTSRRSILPAKSTASSTAARHGRFVPGAFLARRYRIVSAVGEGGMGEVYRAEDVRLGLPVALKFLSPQLTANPVAIRLLHDEVAVARRISHPYVCRVHDVGEVNDDHYLTMEYIDGEDLQKLLRRIGRLSVEKGREIARQLCAGLAAAHDCNVLHRDLKPSNVMIDGRGQVKITDFGLARLNDASHERPEIVGSPAYMAPEQLLRGETSVQSDLFSLGIVLCEIFTGQTVHREDPSSEGNAMPATKPISGAELPSDLDKNVREAILDCLARNPADRPRSAHLISATLSNNNPLAAAVAAGEIPSPELVAAGDGQTIESSRVGLSTAALLLFGLACLLLSPFGRLGGMIHDHEFPLQPAVLEHKAQEILSAAGYDQAFTLSFATGNDFVDAASGFVVNPYQGSADTRDTEPDNHAFTYWYRASPEYFEPDGRFPQTVNWSIPAAIVPGAVRLQMDLRGRLTYFEVQPPFQHATSNRKVDWQGFLSERRIGISWDTLSSTTPTNVPSVPYDELVAWKQNAEGAGTRIEAASFAGRPVYCWITMDQETSPLDTRLLKSQTRLVMLLMIVVAVPLARINWRTQQCDRQGAARVALIVFALHFTVGILAAHAPSAGIPVSSSTVMRSIQHSVYLAAAIWLFYVAIEPHVRRVWPETLISWTRLLHGDFFDSRLGRDVSIGLVVGLFLQFLIRLMYQLADWAGQPLPSFYYGSPSAILSTRMASATLVDCFHLALIGSMYALTFLTVLRLPIRQKGLAAILFVMFHTILLSVFGGVHAWIINLVYWTCCVVLLQRLGLISTVAFSFVTHCVQSFPIPSNLSAWYTNTALIPLTLILALGLFGAYTTTLVNTRSRLPPPLKASG